jgi:hypothetical protein
VSPGRFDAYEDLLRALASGEVWMLLWQGTSGSPDAQYAAMEVAGQAYAPCATSPRELAASGWRRPHEVVAGRDVAAALYPDRFGLWLDPHGTGGGVGVPWSDLRRVAVGLDRHPAGPLEITEPALPLGPFHTQLIQQAQMTPQVRALRCAWVRPVLGTPYLAVGVDLYDTGPRAAEAVREMMRRSVASAPAGVVVSTVSMEDPYDAVALWMRARAVPFYDRAY